MAKSKIVKIIMEYVIASLAFALVIFSIAYSPEASVGFVAPLIPRTSPKHPLYYTKATREEIVRNKQRISAERESFFAQQKLGSTANQIAPIDWALVMTYSIGTPPVEQLAIPDTGSKQMWLQCKPCLKCYKQIKPIFDPELSKSYQRVPCGDPKCHKEFGWFCGPIPRCYYSIRFADNSSTKGEIATDTLSFPETKYSPKFTHPNTLFGCGYKNQQDYSYGPSGVIGLQNVSISLTHQIGASSFSYCRTDNGGYIRFGTASRLVGESTKLFSGRFDIYQIVMFGIEVQKGIETEPVEVDSAIFEYNNDDPMSGVLVDSGTPYTRLHPVAFEALNKTIKDFMKGKEPYEAKGFELCYNRDDSEGPLTIGTMPSVHFVLNDDIVIKFPNENIWTDAVGDGNICLQLLKSKNHLTIIGAVQLDNYNVGFDLARDLFWLDYHPGCGSN